MVPPALKNSEVSQTKDLDAPEEKTKS